MANICVLFRKDIDNQEEYEICKTIIPTYTQRSEVPPNSICIARYSCLPYYLELEKDLLNNNTLKKFREDQSAEGVRSFAKSYFGVDFCTSTLCFPN